MLLHKVTVAKMYLVFCSMYENGGNLRRGYDLAVRSGTAFVLSNYQIMFVKCSLRVDCRTF